MSYYMGDFYPRGDPGIGSFFGGLLRRAAGAIPGVGGTLASLGSKISHRVVTRFPTAAGAVTAAAGAAKMAIVKHPVLSAAGAAGAIGTAGVLMGHEMAMPGARHKGMHINKHGKLVRNRHMRVTNPKALRRSLRRVHGFAKLAMKTIHLVHPKKKGRFGGFRRARKH